MRDIQTGDNCYLTIQTYVLRTCSVGLLDTQCIAVCVEINKKYISFKVFITSTYLLCTCK